MTAPVVQSRTTSTNAATGSHTVNYPATVDAGDLLVCVIAFDNLSDSGNVTDPPTGWDMPSPTQEVTGAQIQCRVLSRIADGTEGGGTFTVTITSTQESAAVVLRITGHNPKVLPYVSLAAGTDTTPDPPSVTHPLGNDDYLWIAAAGSDLAATFSAYPSGYSNGTTAAQGAVNVATAELATASATQNPGTFTIGSSEQWVALTIGIYPATGTAVDGYPYVVERAVTELATSTTHAVKYPAVVDAGDLLIAAVAADNIGTGSFTFPAGWTEIEQNNANTQVDIALFWRSADGTEGGGTFTVTLTVTAEITAHVYRIVDADDPSTTPPTSSTAQSTSGTPDPPSHDAGSSAAYLWLAGAGIDQGAGNFPLTALPSGWINAVESITNEQTSLIMFERVETAQTVNPGSATIKSSRDWASFTIAVPLGAQSVTPTTDPLEEDFTGSDDDPWPVDNWEQDAGSGGGSTTIQNNKGNAKGSNGNGNSGGRGIGKKGGTGNQEATGEVTLCELDEPCRISLWVQGSGDWSGLDYPTNGYGVYLPADSNLAQLVVSLAGSVSVLDTAIWPRDIGTKRWRLRRNQAQVRFRIWDDGDQEPAGWLLQAESSALTAGETGTFQVAYACPSAPSVDACADFDDISVIENPTPGASSGIGGTGAVRKPPVTARR